VEAQEILSAFDDRLRRYTEDLIKKRRAMKIVKAEVTEVTATHVRFKDGSKLACGMVVWSTGLAPRSVRGRGVEGRAWNRLEGEWVKGVRRRGGMNLWDVVVGSKVKGLWVEKKGWREGGARERGTGKVHVVAHNQQLS
jgi:hypothetical protein